LPVTGEDHTNATIDAEYVLLRTESVVTLPLDIDAVEAAPLLCAGVTVFNGIRNMNVRAGGTVAIQGLGGLGHLALQYSRKLGFRTVALSSSAAKKDFAHQLGANEYIDASSEDTVEALNKLGGADLIVCTAPNPAIIGNLENALAPLGKLLVVAGSFFTSSSMLLYAKSISCRRSSSQHSYFTLKGPFCARLAFWVVCR
jgi:D-arabinose 1-dehydrogenase-like Zn-dependent alcohol dehydrogenase